MKKKKNNKKIKNKISEEEFLIALDNITKRLAHKFRFGYHDVADMKQQAAIFALEGLEKYDSSRPLENFLWTHVRNRLFNYKRNNYQRPDKPCSSCPLFDPYYKKSNNQCSKFLNKEDCKPYSVWSNRNLAKKNIMQPSYIDYDLQSGYSLDNFMQNQEILQFLDSNIDTDHRECYLKLKHGDKISKQQFTKLKEYILLLLESYKTSCLKKEDN